MYSYPSSVDAVSHCVREVIEGVTSFVAAQKPTAGGTVECRAFLDCCVATKMVACPKLSIAWDLIPWGKAGDIGGDIAAVLPGLQLGNRVQSSAATGKSVCGIPNHLG